MAEKAAAPQRTLIRNARPDGVFFVCKNLESIERVAEDAGEGYKTVQRFIRLTNLVPELLDMVDEKKIAFNPAVELSYLDEAQQRDFLEAMNDTQNAPSLSQASG